MKPFPVRPYHTHGEVVVRNLVARGCHRLTAADPPVWEPGPPPAAPYGVPVVLHRPPGTLFTLILARLGYVGPLLPEDP